MNARETLKFHLETGSCMEPTQIEWARDYDALAAELSDAKTLNDAIGYAEAQNNARMLAAEARIRAADADNAEALRQLEIARERIQHLNAGIYIVHTMRLNWGLSCPCKCHECDILFEGIRDHLPEGSELETSAQREIAK